jgi:hypothetical protein
MIVKNEGHRWVEETPTHLWSGERQLADEGTIKLTKYFGVAGESPCTRDFLELTDHFLWACGYCMSVVTYPHLDTI